MGLSGELAVAKKRAGEVASEGEGHDEIIESLVEAEALRSMGNLDGRAGLPPPTRKDKTPILIHGFIKNGEPGLSRPVIKGK